MAHPEEASSRLTHQRVSKVVGSILLALVVGLGAAPAWAGAFGKISGDGLNLFPDRERTPIKGFFGTVGLGMSDSSTFIATGDLGFAAGGEEQSMLQGSWIWYLAATPTIELSRETPVPNLAVMTGGLFQVRGGAHGEFPLLTLGAAGGVEGRYDEEGAWGPTVKARLGFWWLTTFVQVSHYGKNDTSVRVGLEVIRFPQIGVRGYSD